MGGGGSLESRHSETALQEIFLNLEEEAICFSFLFRRSYFSFLASVCSVEDRIYIYFHYCLWKIMQAAKWWKLWSRTKDNQVSSHLHSRQLPLNLTLTGHLWGADPSFHFGALLSLARHEQESLHPRESTDGKLVEFQIGALLCRAIPFELELCLTPGAGMRLKR